MIRGPISYRTPSFSVQSRGPIHRWNHRPMSSIYQPIASHQRQIPMIGTQNKRVITLASRPTIPQTPTRNYHIDETFYAFMQHLPPVQGLSSLITYLNHTYLVPWWVLIISLGIALRVSLFPFAKYAMKNRRLQSHPIFKDMKAQIPLKAKTWRENLQLRKELADAMKENGWRWWKNFLPVFAAIPISSMAMCAIGMSLSYDPSMTTGGISWFQDLTATDPWWRLNWIMCLLSVTGWEVGIRRMQTDEYPGLWKIIRYGIPIFFFILIPLVSLLPQGMVLYWTTGSALTALVNLSAPLIRKIYLKFRKTPPQLPVPMSPELMAPDSPVASTPPPPPPTKAQPIILDANYKQVTPPPKKGRGGR
eukprot:TRINITY_DN3435_c0_g1_i1.p1 TRINITY_DN3435_c0_g1~~TRINITY_DN3435_c0_g1_i1.p1  ORF type:complete len:363 (-),score=69.93 TRINITY_DN3435_c0_g1_i1:1041-2129(-)